MHDFFDIEPSRPRVADPSSASKAAAAEELRAARQRARLSLRDVAEQTGLSRGYLSKAENGRLVPSWDVLVRIAAAYGREPRLRLLSIQSGLLDAARALITKTPRQRLAEQEQDPERALQRLVDHGVSFVVSGAVAAILQGLPMIADELSVKVRDDDDNLTAVVHTLMASHVLYREFDPDEMRAECGRTWLVSWCEVRFELVPELPDAVDVMIGDTAAGGFSIPVLPLTTLVATDRDVADVFQQVQAVLAG